MTRPVFSAGRKVSVNLKIVQANISKTPTGKYEFEKLGQAFIDVNESTANIFYISGVVEKKWGLEYVLITSDGLKIEDSSGTQGESLCQNTMCLHMFNHLKSTSLHSGSRPPFNCTLPSQW